MTREDYHRHFSSSHARNGQSVTIPEDVQRVQWHEPCSWCGVREGCKHRRLAA